MHNRKITRRQLMKTAALTGIGVALVSHQSQARAQGRAVSAFASPYADYVFQNGKVYTVNPKQAWADAIAIQGNKIVLVGAGSDAAKWIGPQTQVIDLKGRMLMPGFIDGHAHFVAGAMAKRGVNLNGAKSTAEIVERFREYVKAHPNQDKYLGTNWSFLMFTDHEGTRQDLDSVVADKPVFFLNEDGHNAWFNTKAMENAKIDKDTPDPVPGVSYYRREPDGTPTGMALEPNAFMPVAFFNHVIAGAETLQETMEMTLPMLPKLGITGYHEMGIMAPSLKDADLGYALLQKWEREGKLPVRVVGTLGTRDANEMPYEQLQLLKSWQQAFNSDLVQVNGLKIWGDGVFLAHTGVQLEPYADKPGFYGESDWTKENLFKWIEPAHLAGLDVHIHVDGDAEVRRCLDAFEAVINEHGPMNRRHALHHTGIISPDDLPRFAKLGIGANATGVFFVNYKKQYEEAIKILGQAKVDKEYGVQRKLLPLGVNLSFGSDFGAADMGDVSPLLQMQAAYDGRVPGDTTSPKPNADKLYTLEELLRIYTLNGAYQMRIDDRVGSLQEGKLADLIVLEKNLFDVPKDKLSEVPVQLTMMNGKIVHREGI